jgi:hypothetical protein
VLPISDIPYTVNGKKVELAVKKILAGQQVSSLSRVGIHRANFVDFILDL